MFTYSTVAGRKCEINMTVIINITSELHSGTLLLRVNFIKFFSKMEYHDDVSQKFRKYVQIC